MKLNQATDWLTPYDWYQTAKSVLTPGQYVLWRTEYEDLVNGEVKRRLFTTSGPKPEVSMLTGQEDFADIRKQLKFSKEILETITKLAVMAWKKLPSGEGKTTVLSGIKQRPEEPYEEFIARMQNPPFGSQTDSSGLSWSQKRARKKVKIHRERKLVQKMKTFSLSPPQADSTKIAAPPTWEQIKKLCEEARHTVEITRNQPNPENMFLAMLALVKYAFCTMYWEYFPDPPLLHPVGWTHPSNIKVLMNDTSILGGIPVGSEKPMISTYLDYEGRSDVTPICLALKGRAPFACLPVQYRTLYADAPDKTNTASSSKRVMWELSFQILGYFNYNETFDKDNNVSMPFPNCLTAYRDKDQFWDSKTENELPTWLDCGFPHSASVHWPRGTTDLVFDFSIANPTYDYKKYLKENEKVKFTSYKAPVGPEPVRRWFTPGFVTPMWVAKSSHYGTTVTHKNLFRFAAAANMILLKKPKANLPESIALRACLSYPYAALIGSDKRINITQVGNSFLIQCYSCRLTNCVDASIDKEFSVVIIVKRPEYVMLPVNLHNDPWFDNSALQTLRVLYELIRPKRFVATLIFGIASLIALVTSLAVSTTALIQQVHTVHFVNELNKNVSLALTEHQIIDQKLDSKLEALEEVVLKLGTEVNNLKIQLTTRCHQSFKCICVTPLPYNDSLDWEAIKVHLQGIWKDNSLTHDIGQLQEDISALSQAHLETAGINSLAEDLQKGLKSLNPLD
ncbi:endogenous retrovirus group K member 25 Env polyprotein-like, partial [Dipodomys spectabilis]|uniref:endogenous retrovirus group K member 25 Env polyprotein-like n=1 Tax=Dipodomys spectabilis TaxID=105255 RepID=UPI001C53CD09